MSKKLKLAGLVVVVLVVGIVLGIKLQNSIKNDRSNEGTSKPAISDSTQNASLFDTSKLSCQDTFCSDLFKPLPPPGPHDWLANHQEDGQTYEQFLTAPRNELEKSRNVIYIQPIWEFDDGKSPSLELLRQYTEAFFTIPVKLLPSVSPQKENFSPRINSNTEEEQVHAGLVLSWLLKRIPDDAYCIIGVTMEDLYPDPEWNFVFGYASYEQRVGVFSFVRFDQSFYNQKDSTDHKLLLLRSCKVLTHEIGHMFGMTHCIAYHCNMNGSNNLEESDAQPAWLCPVCLRKLHHVTGFDIIKRYTVLESFYEENEFTYERAWVKLMVEYLQM
jgi:archaemetzincin